MAIPNLCSVASVLATNDSRSWHEFCSWSSSTNPADSEKWAGIARSADSGLLFRAKTNFGLGITPISDFYQRMQLVKCELLRNSTDPNVQKLYETRQTRNQSVKRVWKATNLATTVNAEVDLDLKFPAQESHKGLGFGNFNPNPSQKDRKNWSSKRQFLSLKKLESFILTLSNNNQHGYNGQNLLNLSTFLGKTSSGEAWVLKS